MKSMLLHVQDDEGLEARLQTALALVRASNGHLTCLHVTPISTLVGYESFGTGFFVADLAKAVEEQEAAIRARIESQLASEDVAWSYETATSDPASALVRQGALADVIVLGRFRHNQTLIYPAMAVFGEILSASRTPLLICPKDQKSFDPAGPAVVAWNGSFEAANALRAALPMLQRASSVHVVTVAQEKHFDFPPLGAAEYLSRHDVHAELVSEAGGTMSVDDRLVATATSLGAAYMVMGAYGHSRVREFLFGGVTRSLLHDCPLPLIVTR